MIEEAAGTRMYESKKQVAQKTIEKKEAKLAALDEVGALFCARIASLLSFVEVLHFTWLSLFKLPCTKYAVWDEIMPGLTSKLKQYMVVLSHVGQCCYFQLYLLLNDSLFQSKKSCNVLNKYM